MQDAPAVEIENVSVQGVFKTGELEPEMGLCILFFEWENACSSVFCFFCVFFRFFQSLLIG